MMKTRRTGTLCPKKDTGGLLRRGMIALVVLLLACVLMAGAVSAGSQSLTKDSGFNFTKGEYATISEAGWYKLNATGAGNISITATSGNVILNSTSGIKLTGNITISGSANVTIDGMDIIVNNSTLYESGKRVSAIRVTATTPGCLVLQCSNITFDSSVNSKKGDVIVSNHALNESKVINNTIWNVPGHALRIHGLQGGKSMEVDDNTVTVNPDEKIAGKDGRALLKIWSDTISSDTTYTVYDNVVTKVSGAQNDSLLVRADDIKSPSYIKITMYNNSLDNSGGNSYAYLYIFFTPFMGWGNVSHNFGGCSTFHTSSPIFICFGGIPGENSTRSKLCHQKTVGCFQSMRS